MNCRGPMTLMLTLGVFSCAESKNKSDVAQDEAALLPIETSEPGKKFEVDASSRTDWVGFDFDTGAFIGVSELPANSNWDLAFKRTSIKMNGASVKMRIIDKDFAGLEQAPKEGYVGDQPSADPAAIETAGLAFHADPVWYAYDINTHVVSSQNLVYVIQTNDGRYFKLKILDYYNAARLPAYINFEYQQLKEVEP